MGAVFGALAVVPLVLVGIEARRTLWLESASYWVGRYRWPIWFFLGACFWNLVGGGIFGFMLNPPIALYYVQGLQTTPLHSHAALFGVHGLFALGLVLFIARKLSGEAAWREGMLAAGFWAMNAGLVATIALSLLPLGVLQAEACIEKGLWFARSPAFLEQPLVSSFRWARLIGESLFIVGVGCFVLFMVGLWTGRSREGTGEGAAGSSEASARS
jgi:nitric oxide reductase subunit B